MADPLEVATEEVVGWIVAAARPRIVCSVAGESGVGKTTLALRCRQACDAHGLPATVLHQDDYFLLPPRQNHQARLDDLAQVGEQEVDMVRLERDLAAFRGGAAELTIPTLDAHADRFAERSLDLSQLRVLFVEGTYVTGLSGIDLRVFVEGDPSSTSASRRARARDLIDDTTQRILAIEHRLIAPHRERADRVFRQLSPSS